MISLGCDTQQEGDSWNRSVTQGPSSLDVLMLKSREVLRHCVLSPGWCYREESDLEAMGQHAFRWLAPRCFSLAVPILLHVQAVEVCVVYAGRRRLRSQNVVNGAQVSPAGRAIVIHVGMVQIKQLMRIYLLAPFQIDYGSA